MRNSCPSALGHAQSKPIKHGTGGAVAVELMKAAATLRAELPGLGFVHLVELARKVVEGTFHTGLGAVVRAIGVKPAMAPSAC